MSIEKSPYLAPGEAGLTDASDMDVEVELEAQDGAPLPQESEVAPAAHDENLAEGMDPSELGAIAAELESLIQLDLGARSDWEKTYKNGLKLLGLQIEHRVEPWDGACGIVHPMIAEAAVRFQAEMVVETFPAGGPVRTKILGKETADKKIAAMRVEEEMNHQLTDVMSEFRSEHEKAMWHLPIAGNAFKKVYYDDALQRQTSMFVPPEDVILPYGSSDVRSAQRVTHYMRRSLVEIEHLQEQGFYRKVRVEAANTGPNTVQDQKDKAIGASPINDLRPEIYEVQVELDLNAYAGGLTKTATSIAETAEGPQQVELDFGENEDGSVTVEVETEPARAFKPYVLTFVKGTTTVLALRRNWVDGDETYARRQHFVQYQYVPGFGPYAFGLIHLIGGYAKSATSVLRQLVDAGTLANLPGGLKTRGLRIKGDDAPIAPGEFRDVDVGSGAIKDNIMTLPYKDPSVVLAGLLDKIIEQGQRFASTADLDISKMSAQSPVGTTLALLERQLKVMSAVQARCHFSLKQELKLLAEIIRDGAETSYEYDPVEGARGLLKEDFQHVDIIPVSDPNASTMSQRIIQYSSVMQMSQQAPSVYDQAVLHREMLDVIGIKNASKIVPLPGDMKPRDPVTENMHLLTGKPTKAFLQQDHQAHMAVHQMLLQDPQIQAAIGQNPQAQAIQAALMAHIAEHAAFAYRMQIVQQLGMPLPDPEQDIDPQVEREFAPILAQAAQQALVMNQKLAVAQAQAQAAQDPAFQLEERQVRVKEEDSHTKRIDAQTKRMAVIGKLANDRDAQDAENSAEGIRLAHEAQQSLTKPAPEAA